MCLLFNLYAKKGSCICIQSERPLHPPFALSPRSTVYIKSPSRSRCQPIKYIHFPVFSSAAHLLNMYEWRPLNSIQFTFKACFIGTTDVLQLIVQQEPTLLHLLHKKHFVKPNQTASRLVLCCHSRLPCMSGKI